MTDPVLELIQKQELQYQISGRDYVVRCLNPDHPDTNPSLRIDKVTGSFHCFSCGFKGNIFKFYGVLTNHASIRIQQLKQKLRALQQSGDFVLPNGVVPYTKTFRGISPQTLKQFEAFYTVREEKLLDRICFPVKDITGKTVVVVARHLHSSGNPRYVNWPGGVSMPLFPAAAPTGSKSIVFVEGLFDFLNLYDKGLHNVCCCFGTNTIHRDIEQKLLPLRAQGITHAYILFDGDEAGAKAARELESVLEKHNFVTETIKLPSGLDPGDLDQESVTGIREYIHK
jgi:DNA primase